MRKRNRVLLATCIGGLWIALGGSPLKAQNASTGPTSNPSGQAAASPGPAPHRAFMGINEWNAGYWCYARFADAARSFGKWFPNSATPASGVAVDANNYPTVPASSLSLMLEYPPGTYTATWDGTATIRIKDLASPRSFWSPTGPNSATWTIGPNHQCNIEVSGLDPAHPLANLHIWAPGYEDGSRTYLAPYSRSIGAFACIRAMDAQSISTSADVNWTDRVTPARWGWGENHGVPLEAEAALAIESGVKRLWVCIPIGASPDYILQMATLLHATVPPGVEVMVEYSNEIWNWGGGFNGWPFINNEANKLNQQAYDGKFEHGAIVPGRIINGVYHGVTDSNTRAARCAAVFSRNASLIFSGVYADRPSDFSMVWAGQSGGLYWVQSGLEWVKAKYGSVSCWKYVAIAPYFQYPENSPQTLSEVFAGVSAQIATVLRKQVRAHQLMCEKYGLQLVCYEAGQAFAPLNQPYDGKDLTTQAMTDPRMGIVHEQYFSMLRANGVVLCNYFAFLGEPWSNTADYWGLLQGYGDQTTTNYRWMSVLHWTN